MVRSVLFPWYQFVIILRSVFHLLLFKDDVYCTYSDSIVARRGGLSIIIIIGHWSKPLSDVMIDYENCRTMKKLLLTNENIKTCVFKWTHNAAIIYWWPFSPTLFAFVVCWKQGTVAMLNLKMIHSKKNSKDFNALTWHKWDFFYHNQWLAGCVYPMLFLMKATFRYSLGILLL